MFNIPNVFTSLNLISGVLAIILAITGQITWACGFIYLAGLFDFLDGFLARKLGVSGELGKQLDSLADMVTFGVAPGILVFVLLVCGVYGVDNFGISKVMDVQLMDFSSFVRLRLNSYFSQIYAGDFSARFLLPLAALIVPFFSLFRLAKFNIDVRQSESFIGLPTPANTIFITAFPMLYSQAFSTGSESDIIFKVLDPIVFIPIVLIFSLLLISELPLFSLKFKHFKFQGNEVRFVFLGLVLILIPILFAWSIPIIIILYLLLSVIENKRKKTQDEV